MKQINWNEEKNIKLINERGISFNDVLIAINHNNILSDIAHPNKQKYPNQRMFIIAIHEYVYTVPYVENEIEIFLKTVIPNRKLTEQYLRGKK